MDMLLSFSRTAEPELDDVSESPAPGESSSLTDSDTDYSSTALISGTVSGGDAGAGSPYTPGALADPHDYSEYLGTILTNMETLIVQNDRLQAQNEACISLLLIIVIVGMLNYVYKFFKIFF